MNENESKLLRLREITKRWRQLPPVNRELVCATLIEHMERAEHHAKEANSLGFLALHCSTLNTRDAWMVFQELHDAILTSED